MLTDAVANAIVDAVGIGISFQTACQLAGIAPSTGHDWLQRGHREHPRRARGPRFVEFAEAIARARARERMARATRISQAAKRGKKILGNLSYTEPDGTVVEEVRYFEADWPTDITPLEGYHPRAFQQGRPARGPCGRLPLNEEAT